MVDFQTLQLLTNWFCHQGGKGTVPLPPIATTDLNGINRF